MISHASLHSRWPVRVTNCRDDSIDLMSGVPQIAADLLATPKSAALGHKQTQVSEIQSMTAPPAISRTTPVIHAALSEAR
jgi:hypothetical protein